ncbi:hypothetical protein C4580_03955 [Candidatus Woesearchaeota archaeon]|nr:MAG: hypothetical protein C4580_03955 [Candidatus Woesearchaeota archaeon]
MISVYCSEKLDGICAAAIIFRHARFAKLPAHFAGFLHPDLLSRELQDISTEKNKLLFLLDISLSPEHLPLLDHISKHNKIVYANTTNPNSVKPNAKIFDQHERQSSAEQAKNRFLPNDPVSAQLATLSHEYKFWKINDDKTLRLADLIASGHNPLDIITSLSRGVLWNDTFQKTYDEFTIKKNAALEELMKTIIIKTHLTYRIGYCLASPILTPTDACEKILNSHAGVDIACALHRDGKITFRRREHPAIDLRELAELFGGGGQPFAAGARLPYQITKDNLPDTLFKIEHALRAYFLQGDPELQNT